MIRNIYSDHTKEVSQIEIDNLRSELEQRIFRENENKSDDENEKENNELLRKKISELEKINSEAISKGYYGGFEGKNTKNQ